MPEPIETLKINYRKIAEDNGWYLWNNIYGNEGVWDIIAPSGVSVNEGSAYEMGERLHAIGRELLHNYVANRIDKWTTAALQVIGPCDEILKHEDFLRRFPEKAKNKGTENAG